MIRFNEIYARSLEDINKILDIFLELNVIQMPGVQLFTIAKLAQGLDISLEMIIDYRPEEYGALNYEEVMFHKYDYINFVSCCTPTDIFRQKNYTHNYYFLYPTNKSDEYIEHDFFADKAY